MKQSLAIRENTVGFGNGSLTNTNAGAGNYSNGYIKPKKTCPMFYTKGEEIFNAVTHIVGGAFGIAALITLLYFAAGNTINSIAVATFAVCITILYTMSALYHFLPCGTGKAVFRVFDHCTIFLLIAGTYTPYCLIALAGTKIGIIILIVEWSLCIAGITMNAIAMNNMIIKSISMVMYVVMGWMITLAFKLLIAAISPASFWLLLLGGVAYTGGIIFFAFGKKVKYFHSIWHLFDLLGTALQFASILLLLI
jgi:hemolysin III